MIKLSIIIPVYNNCNFTESCLTDLIKLPLYCEIIVIDNNSSDNTEQVIKKIQSNHTNIIYKRLDNNLLHSGGCNQGYKLSTGKNIMFLNNDIRVKSNFNNWVEYVIELCELGYLVGGTGGQLTSNFNFIIERNYKFWTEVKQNNSLLNTWNYPDYLYNEKFFYLSGWCLSSSRENFDKLKINGLGPWNELLFYFNDFDISARARQLGIPFEIPNLPLIHFSQITTKKFFNVSEMYLNSQKICKEIWQGKL